MINTIIKGIGSVPPVFYVTGLAVISLIIIMIRIILIIKAPYSEFSMNSVKTLMRGTELSFVVLLVSLAVGLYGIRSVHNWLFFVALCFIPLFFTIRSCELIINNPDKTRIKEQQLGVMISFIITALIIISAFVSLLLVSVELPPLVAASLIAVVIILLVERVLD